MSAALPSVVCFSNLDWGYLRYRKQHLMDRIAQATPVTYVNPPRAAKWRHLRPWLTVTSPKPGLSVLEPPVLPGIRRSSLLRELNYRAIALILRRFETAAESLPILWIYSPHASRFVDLIPHSLVVYDMADDYSVPTGSFVRGAAETRELAMLDGLERHLIGHADLVLCVSEPLLHKATAAGAARAVLLPNGCDLDAYEDAPAPPRRLGHPTVGYIGTVAPRVDVELVVELARLRPDWTIEVVGPVSPLVQLPSNGPKNLRWAGEVPYEEVPGRIKAFDACILPLREIDYAYRSSPIQVFDYLAAGKPVVSSPVAQFEAWPSIVTTARGARGFAFALDEVMLCDTVEQQNRRREFVRSHSWQGRVSSALELIGDLLRSRRTEACSPAVQPRGRWRTH